MHIHTEAKVLPLKDHMYLLACQYRENAKHHDHPLYDAIAAPDPDRQMKGTALLTAHVATVHSCDNQGEEEKQRERNRKILHTEIVKNHIENRPINPLIQMQSPEIHKTEMLLPRGTRRTLAQMRAHKCPLLQAYLHDIGGGEDPGCPMCGHERHDTQHLFECPQMPTELTPIHLWRSPAEVADLLERWKTALGAEEAQEAAVRQ